MVLVNSNPQIFRTVSYLKYLDNSQNYMGLTQPGRNFDELSLKTSSTTFWLHQDCLCSTTRCLSAWVGCESMCLWFLETIILLFIMLLKRIAAWINESLVLMLSHTHTHTHARTHARTHTHTHTHWYIPYNFTHCNDFGCFLCLLLFLLLCPFYVRVDTLISRNGMNKIFCIL